MDKKAMVYIQSGGPTAVINTSLYGAIKEAKKHSDVISNIYGSCYGIEGLIYNDLIDLNAEDDEQIELLKQTPGSILGTTRYKLPKDFHDPQYTKILSTLKRHNIGYVFVNGGNDSMDTCYKLSLLCKEMNYDCRVIGVPKTVDNDLAETDHSLGFGSAAKYVINTVQLIVEDANCYHKGKVFIIEIMGRNAGWLTAAASLVSANNRPDFIYLPENKFDVNDFVNNVDRVYKEKGKVIVAISEGIVFERDSGSARVDAFNHVQLGGAGSALADIIEKRLNLPTRSIELSLPQRSYSILTSKVDSLEAEECGKIAVLKAIEGMSGYMVAIKRVSDNPYSVKYEMVDISKIANVEQRVPKSMMASSNSMAESFSSYCLPLIQGELDIKYKNGVIETAVFKRVKVK